MIELINAEIIEATTLLETIYKNTNENPETDCAIGCLLRSLYFTRDKANQFVISLSDDSIATSKVTGDIND